MEGGKKWRRDRKMKGKGGGKFLREGMNGETGDRERRDKEGRWKKIRRRKEVNEGKEKG